MISVTLHKPTYDLGPHWQDLLSRAQPNVFMSPAALKAAHDTMFAKVHMLLAWDQDVEPRRLVGLWAFQQRRLFPFWPSTLDALPYEYAFLSSPIVDPAFVSKTLPAFLEAIGNAPGLPKVMTLKSFDGDTASYEALIRSLAARGGRSITLRTESRPMIWRGALPKLSGERRKKLRQSWKKLCALGATEIVSYTKPDDAAEALETFFQLEMKSWKGEAGTALLCKEADAVFARRLIGDLAARGEVSIQMLRVDGCAIAAHVLLFSGAMVYAWKTAFDPAFAKFSPGVILIDKATEDLFARTDIKGIDSCSAESSFMGQLWSGRRSSIDILIDVGPAKSMAFILESFRQATRERLKRLRDRIAAGIKTPQPGHGHLTQASSSGSPVSS